MEESETESEIRKILEGEDSKPKSRRCAPRTDDGICPQTIRGRHESRALFPVWAWSSVMFSIREEVANVLGREKRSQNVQIGWLVESSVRRIERGNTVSTGRVATEGWLPGADSRGASGSAGCIEAREL